MSAVWWIGDVGLEWKVRCARCQTRHSPLFWWLFFIARTQRQEIKPGCPSLTEIPLPLLRSFFQFFLWLFFLAWKMCKETNQSPHLWSESPYLFFAHFFKFFFFFVSSFGSRSSGRIDDKESHDLPKENLVTYLTKQPAQSRSDPLSQSSRCHGGNARQHTC